MAKSKRDKILGGDPGQSADDGSRRQCSKARAKEGEEKKKKLGNREPLSAAGKNHSRGKKGISETRPLEKRNPEAEKVFREAKGERKITKFERRQ